MMGLNFVSVIMFLCDGYYLAYKPITFPCILFMFSEMKFIYYYFCVMLVMKSKNICNG